MMIRPYRPETLRGVKVFHKLGEVGLEEVVVGEGHIAAVINHGKCVSVFDHGAVEHGKKGEKRHVTEPPTGFDRGGGMKLLPQQDVLVLAEPNNVPICECLFHKNAALNTLHLVIIRRSGHVEMWDHRSGKWGHGVSMKLYTGLFGTIVSACITDSGSLVYVEKGKSAMYVRTVTLTQGAVGLNSSLVGSTQKAPSNEVLAQLPLQDALVVKPGPHGRVWVICPQSQILLLPLDPGVGDGTPPPTFALSAKSRPMLPGPAPQGPCLEYTTFCHHPATTELVLFNARTGQLSVLSAATTADRGTVTDLKVCAAASLADVVAPSDAASTSLCYLTPTTVGLLSKERLMVVDVMTGRTGWSSIPHGLIRAAHVTKGYTGPPLLVGECGIFQAKCDGILDPPPMHHAPPSARAAAQQHPGEIDWTTQLAAIPEDTEETIARLRTPGTGHAGGGRGWGGEGLQGSTRGREAQAAMAGNGECGHTNPLSQHDVLKRWIDADTPHKIMEAGEALGEYFNIIAPAVGQRPLPTRAKVTALTQPPPGANGMRGGERGRRKVRLVMPPVDGDDQDDVESCDDLDVHWSNRIQRYTRAAVEDGLWGAMHAAEAAAEDMVAALQQKATADPLRTPSTPFDLFQTLVAAGTAGEADDDWTPPTAPCHATSLVDAACAVLDDLGLYALAEPDTQLALLKHVVDLPLAPDVVGMPAVPDVTIPPEILLALARRETLPHALADALPVLFDGMPHVVAPLALMLAGLAHAAAAHHSYLGGIGGALLAQGSSIGEGSAMSSASPPQHGGSCSPRYYTPSPPFGGSATTDAALMAAFNGGGADHEDTTPAAMLRWVCEATLPHLLPCAVPTVHPHLTKCRARAVCVLLMWTGDVVRAVAHGCATWDIAFINAVLGDGGVDKGQAVAAAKLVMEHVLQHEGEFMERAAGAPPAQGDGATTAAAAAAATPEVMSGDVAAALQELQPLTQDDWGRLRRLLWQHIRGDGGGGGVSSVSGADVQLLNLLNANPLTREEDDEVVDVYAALRVALSSYVFGEGFTEDVNAAAAGTLELMAAEGGYDEFCKMIVEPPFGWDHEQMCFTPYLDKNRAHLLQGHIAAKAEPTPSLRSQYLAASASLSVSDTPTTPRTECDSPPVAQHADISLYPAGNDPHPLAVPLKDVLPLLGIDVAAEV